MAGTLLTGSLAAAAPSSIAEPSDGGVGEPEPGSPLPRPLKIEVPDQSQVAAEHSWVVFHGNVLFSDFVYRSLLAAPQHDRPTPADAIAVVATLRAFLANAGFDLATVSAVVKGDQIAVEVDEGQLDKIVVFGGGLVETLRFKRGLSLPANVFDRRALEKHLGELAGRYHLNHYSYELVPVGARVSTGPELESLGPVLGLPGIRPGQRYELHILIASDPWSRGFQPEASVDPLEGLGVGGSYRSEGLLFAADRWEGVARYAGAVRPYLESPGSRVVFTRALQEARWFSPPLIADGVRPALTVRADLFSLQRGDLGLDNFDQATFTAATDLTLVLLPQLTLTGRIGVERRFLFDIDEVAGASAAVDQAPRVQTRLYAEVLGTATLNPEELRIDRKHELDLQARWYIGTPSSAPALWLRANYQRRFTFGWHELWLTASGKALFGQVLFPDDESVASHLHGAFGTSLFTHTIAGAGLEYRFSLARDALKVGVFYDQVVFASLNLSGGPESPRVAGAWGPSLHLLLADEFEGGAYLAVGWRTGAIFDFAPTLTLRQVF